MGRLLRVLALMLSAYSGVGYAQIMPPLDPSEQVHGTSTLNVTDVSHNRLAAYDESQLNVLAGAEIGDIYAFNDSLVTLSEGSNVGVLYAFDDSNTLVTGGTLELDRPG